MMLVAPGSNRFIAMTGEQLQGDLLEGRASDGIERLAF